MSARAVAVIQPAPTIIALPMFLCILSGKRQLHASRYLLNVFCCPLLVQVSGAQFSWLERLPVTQEVEGSSPVAPAKFHNYIWQEIGIG
jgi:hypothetical protein